MRFLFLVALCCSACAPVPTPVEGVAKCLGCHQEIEARWNFTSSHNLLFDCAQCHAEAGARHQSTRVCGECHSAKGHRQYGCADCHDVHGSPNLFLMRETFLGERLTLSAPVLVDGQGAGVCQQCHSRTAHYRQDGSGTPHPGDWCITCHAHGDGFLPDAGSGP